jgi:hypothetical protein
LPAGGKLIIKRSGYALNPKLKVLLNSGYAEQAIMQSAYSTRRQPLIGNAFRKQQLADF